MPENNHVANYKAILRSVIDQRPSGMSQRLSEALGINRSFVSQISNPTYKIPVPYKHVDMIFKVCGFTAKQKEMFLGEYYLAHPKYANRGSESLVLNQQERLLSLPSTGNEKADAEIDRLVVKLVSDMVSVYNKLK